MADELAPDDIRGDVAAAFASLKDSGAAASDSGDAQPSADAASTPQPSSASEPQSPERPRAPDGKFAKVEQAQAAPEKPIADADPSLANSAQPSTADEAPKGWSADAKTKWSSLDPSIRAEVMRRETQTDEAGRRWSQEKSTYEATLAPLRASAQRNGVTAEQGLQRLLAADDFLTREPEQAMLWLARTYGVDLAKLASAGAAGSSQQPSSPQQPSRPAPVDPALHQRLSHLEGYIEQTETAKVNATLAEFTSQKDAQGNPRFPHFEAVKVDMGQQMQWAAQRHQEMSLEQAYEAAVWSRPDLRTQLLSAQSSAVAQAQKEREAAEKARRGAGLGVSGSPNGRVIPAPADAGDTVEDAVRAAIRQHAPH